RAPISQGSEPSETLEDGASESWQEWLNYIQEKNNDPDTTDADRKQLDAMLVSVNAAIEQGRALPSPDGSENRMFAVPKSPVSTQKFDREYGKYALIGIMLLVPMVIAAAVQGL